MALPVGVSDLPDRTRRQFEAAQQSVERYRATIQYRLLKKHPQFAQALKKHHKTLEQLGEDALRAGGAAALAGALLFLPAGPKIGAAQAENVPAQAASQAVVAPAPVDVRAELTTLLPDAMKAPTSSGEQQIADMLSSAFQVSATPELEGHRLNVVHSIMGGEQHLHRYPGDGAAQHTGPGIEPGAGGVAPGNGAYGYWAHSKAELSDQAVKQEQYYVAVQTFLAPGFRDNPNSVYEWFRYRKMLVVNAKTGQAVVAVVGDAGPATWTGKSSGGSPEVMDTLGLGEGSRKGPVLLYFLNDPNNSVPLGPIAAKPPAAPAPGGA